MATAHVDVPPQDIVLHLHLSQQEASLLKALVQNETSCDEDDMTRSLRETIWHALDRAGTK